MRLINLLGVGLTLIALIPPQVCVAEDYSLLFNEEVGNDSSTPFVEFRARKGGVGHAFLFLGVRTPSGNTVYYGAAGFYPEEGSTTIKTIKNVLDGPGKVDYKLKDLRSDVHYRANVTPAQKNEIEFIVKGWDPKKDDATSLDEAARYKLFSNNCISMMRDVAEDLGIKTNDRAFPWDFVEQLSKDNGENTPIDAASRDADRATLVREQGAQEMTRLMNAIRERQKYPPAGPGPSRSDPPSGGAGSPLPSGGWPGPAPSSGGHGPTIEMEYRRR